MDCTTCKHNTYIGNPDKNWVSCCHPKTLAKMPRPEHGDPIWVDLMTADMPVKQFRTMNLGECPTFEAVKQEAAQSAE